jgi:hypothetical protein
MTSQATPRRTRTPSALLWLLNERDALRGELERPTRTVADLEVRLAKATATVARTEAALSHFRSVSQTTEARLRAMEVVLTRTYPEVNQHATAPVRAWAGKYGKRGGLRRFLATTLENAQGLEMPTAALVEIAKTHFGLALETLRERQNFYDTVHAALRELRDANPSIRHVRQTSHNSQSRWQWVSAVPSVDELLRLARQAGAGEES